MTVYPPLAAPDTKVCLASRSAVELSPALFSLRLSLSLPCGPGWRRWWPAVCWERVCGSGLPVVYDYCCTCCSDEVWLFLICSLRWFRFSDSVLGINIYTKMVAALIKSINFELIHCARFLSRTVIVTVREKEDVSINLHRRVRITST